jgi:hypothetical protein
MGVLRTVIEIPVLAVLYTWQEFSLRRAIAFELIRDEDLGHVDQALEEFAEKLLRRLLVPAALDENIQHVAVLVHGAPEIMTFAVDGEEYLIQVPFVARSGTPPF